MPKAHPPKHGFDLLIGPALANGFYREDYPKPAGMTCLNCGSHDMEVWHLSKLMFAFGGVFKKHLFVKACNDCYHEVPMKDPTPPPPKNQSNLKIFKSLPADQQQRILRMLQKKGGD